MDHLLQHASTKINTVDFRPLFFDLNKTDEKDALLNLLKDDAIVVHNTIEKQIAELIKIANPSHQFSETQMHQKITEHLGDVPAEYYGTWVYYPWSKKLIHILNEEDFIAVRTNRNLYKVSPEEIEHLRTKKIAIIGLSVGQSIAQTIATERICGELRLADFDSLELGNLNRLNAGIQDLGTSKVIIAARKIAEIDPYIKVYCWPEGINENNLEEFLTANGRVDIVIEECDSLVIKILTRLKAKEYGIPVVMETNDVGMLDIERFDIEKERSIFHENLKEIENIPSSALALHFKKLTFEEKVGYISKIIGFENISEEMKFSFSEINKTITGWPQLASAVSLGAALVTDTCRRILLKKFNKSGRYFVHFDELVK